MTTDDNPLAVAATVAGAVVVLGLLVATEVAEKFELLPITKWLSPRAAKALRDIPPPPWW